jgi:murein DD-endopeptidase MepM/ murein hydrolase activator NlpD
VNEVRGKLGAGVAAALAAQMQLSQTLQQNDQQQEGVRGSLNAAGAQVAQLDGAIAARQTQIEATQARIGLERAQIAAIARAMYLQPGSLLERMLRARDLRDALVGTADLEAASHRGQELKASLAHDLDSLQAAQLQQSADRRREAMLVTAQQRALDALHQLQQQEEQTSRALSAAIPRTQDELKNIDKQSPDLVLRLSKELEDEQAQLVAAAEQEAWSQTVIWLELNPVSQMLPSSGHSALSRFIWPMPDFTISQGFGPTDFELEPAYAGFPHFHKGLDMVEPAGSAVLAADDGVVAAAATGAAGYGNYVVIAHASGITTLYGHLAVLMVQTGQQVSQGQPIGLEGSTGMSTGPHCHFEMRVNGQPVDPTPFLPQRP